MHAKTEICPAFAERFGALWTMNLRRVRHRIWYRSIVSITATGGQLRPTAGAPFEGAEFRASDGGSLLLLLSVRFCYIPYNNAL